LSRLQVLGSVLYVAAHPDDENTAMLAWLTHMKGVRTAYLSMTRGDGGQNLIGDELGPALGVIRTHELLAARPHGWSRAALHASDRLRLLQERAGDTRVLGARLGALRRGVGDPPVPAGRDHRALPAGFHRGARTPHGVVGAGA
jgi:hypothetical protein